MNNELIEKMKAAKTTEEIIEIARKELSLEDTDNVAGGTGRGTSRVELTEAQAEHVVGGGHMYKDSMGSEMWVSLMDEGYVLGTDSLYDRAYVLEGMAAAGFIVEDIIGMGVQLFPGSTPRDVEKAIRAGGPAYLADCFREAHGLHW